MRSILTVLIFAALSQTARAEPAPYAKQEPVSFKDVVIDDAFWSPRLKVNHESTVPAVLDWCEETGRLTNFDKASGRMQGEFEGIYFNDSDVYKAIEGAAYALAVRPDPALRERVDKLIERIAAAQQADGYLNTFYTVAEPGNRWSNLKDKHELYCAGHLIEAGVAYFEATGERSLLDVAIRYADLIGSLFGPGKRHGVPGHEELELALVKLYRVTGEERYLKLAEYFIDQRGHDNGRELYGESSQDHLPVRDQHRVFGHAVRAMYLYSGVADVAAINGDPGYFTAMDDIWTDLVENKMYVTGGIGVANHGEGFATEYDLPNQDSYAETCASIALALFNHRLTTVHGDARYADVFERVLYNGLLAGVSLDGDKFNYRNPLASRGPQGYDPSGGKQGDSPFHRQYWYSCACCPTNIVRFIPQIGGFIYATDDDGLYVNQYIGSRTTIADVHVQLETALPWNGDSTLTFGLGEPSEFDVCLRIPGWSRGYTLSVNGEPAEASLEHGYARIHRTWKNGDAVTLSLPMPIERVHGNPMIEADRGRVALQRGPLMYCLEEMDNPVSVHHIALPPDAPVVAEREPNLLDGVTVLRGYGQYRTMDGWKHNLYRFTTSDHPVAFTAVPYYAWDNRTPGGMELWLPEHPDFTPVLTLAARAHASSSYRNEGDTLYALNDQVEPSSSHAKGQPRFTWWKHKGTEEWAAYQFPEAETVSAVEVYWYDDSDKGGCKAPASWRLSYHQNGQWLPVEARGEYGVEIDRYNQLQFTPVKTDGLRIEVQLQEDASAGILEWRVW
ncbi:MAG: glycoside hydrolase family 127 protein [bacterium]|nr:glycoside hydrolase family 127 protein [bacterium]